MARTFILKNLLIILEVLTTPISNYGTKNLILISINISKAHMFEMFSLIQNAHNVLFFN